MLCATLGSQSKKELVMAETKTQKRKRKKRVPENETRSDRWRRLVGERSDKFIHHVKLLKNLRSSAYDPDPEMEQMLFDKFQAELNDLRTVWRLEPEEEATVEEEDIDEDEVEEVEVPSQKQEVAVASDDSDPEW